MSNFMKDYMSLPRPFSSFAAINRVHEKFTTRFFLQTKVLDKTGIAVNTYFTPTAV